MQKTLLQAVQDYLDATSGFYVDSIFDTDESQQVAKIAERVYYNMVQTYSNLLFTMKESTLESLSDTARPNYMLLPANAQKIQESKIWYDVSEDNTKISYRELAYLSPLDFINKTRASSETNSIIVEGFDGTKMSCGTNKMPHYYTSFDNRYVVFDSYDSDVDTTLQQSKTRLVISMAETFLQEDDFVIPVPAHLTETYMDMFLNEALTLVYQQPIGMIAQRARAGKIKLQQDNRTIGSSRSPKRYGRRG